MSYSVRFTERALRDLDRQYRFLVNDDIRAAEHALHVMEQAWQMVELFPFSCRKARSNDPFLREYVMQFGRGGYVALYRIDIDQYVTILAVRHARERDFAI